MTNTTYAAPAGPGWASALGVVIIVLGVFFSAWQATQWLAHADYQKSMPASGQLPAAVCPEEELEEEGISLTECNYMAENVEGLILSMPPWFLGMMQWTAALGTALAFASIVIGGALVNYRPWSGGAVLGLAVALALVDALQFAAVVNAGPVVRSIYLWHIVLWFLLHMLMAVGAAAGKAGESEGAPRAAA